MKVTKGLQARVHQEPPLDRAPVPLQSCSKERTAAQRESQGRACGLSRTVRATWRRTLPGSRREAPSRNGGQKQESWPALRLGAPAGLWTLVPLGSAACAPVGHLQAWPRFAGSQDSVRPFEQAAPALALRLQSLGRTQVRAMERMVLSRSQRSQCGPPRCHRWRTGTFALTQRGDPLRVELHFLPLFGIYAAPLDTRNCMKCCR